MYYFRGRMNYAPQTWIETWQHTPGFIYLDDCIGWCKKNLFGFTVYHFEGKKKVEDYKSEN